MNQLINIKVPAVVNKPAIKNLARGIIDEALEKGTVLRVAEGLAVVDKLVKSIREEDRFVDAVVEATNKRHTTDNGTVIEVTEVAVKYDYSYDPEWSDIKYRIDCLQQNLKDREALLKNKQPGKEYVDEETGEVLVGAAKSSKTSYKITLSK